MSDRSVKIERIVSVRPHPNADKLELAQIGLYNAIVPKGVFKEGEYALYIPEGVILPDDLLEELGLTGKLAGSGKNRVKTIRLRGEYSQGIVCRPSKVNEHLDTLFGEYDWTAPLVEYNSDYTTFDWSEVLGIVPWVPKIPAHFAGEWEQGNHIPWIEIQNIKRYPDIFEEGEPVFATEKIHGTCLIFTYDRNRGRSYVTSKGVGSRGLCLIEDETNVYWKIVREYDLEGIAQKMLSDLEKECDGEYALPDKIGIFGEIYGPGIQDLTYGVEGYKLVAFDVYFKDGPLDWNDWIRPDFLNREYGLPVVPTLYEGPYDFSVLAELAEGDTVFGNGSCMREGIVVRPLKERFSKAAGGRCIGKIVGNGYLTRKNGTEFE